MNRPASKPLAKGFLRYIDTTALPISAAGFFLHFLMAPYRHLSRYMPKRLVLKGWQAISFLHW